MNLPNMFANLFDRFESVFENAVSSSSESHGYGDNLSPVITFSIYRGRNGRTYMNLKAFENREASSSSQTACLLPNGREGITFNLYYFLGSFIIERKGVRFDRYAKLNGFELERETCAALLASVLSVLG